MSESGGFVTHTKLSSSEHVVLLRKAIEGFLKKLLLHVRVHDTKATDMLECAGHYHDTNNVCSIQYYPWFVFHCSWVW